MSRYSYLSFGRNEHTNRLVSLKICVATAESQRELNIYDRLPPGKERHVISLLDTFSFRGPNGTHVVLVQNVVGSFDGLKDLVRKQAREVCKQIIHGVAFLHSHGVTHGGKSATVPSDSHSMSSQIYMHDTLGFVYLGQKIIL